MITNVLTIDVEDYFMVTGFSDIAPIHRWGRFESRIQANTEKLLYLLDEHAVKATFFVVGWIAEHFPLLVRQIHGAGHEIACHGYSHQMVNHMGVAAFREDLRKAKGLLEDSIGGDIVGYRAPSWSIMTSTLWALDVLIEEGLAYDSSIFPIHHDRYGYPQACRFKHVIERHGTVIVEFPASTYRLLRYNVPVGGGGYLRLFPFPFTRLCLTRINALERQPFLVYVHPWEIDMHQPRLTGRSVSRFRHYVNLRTTVSKLRKLLTEFTFKPVRDFL